MPPATGKCYFAVPQWSTIIDSQNTPTKQAQFIIIILLKIQLILPGKQEKQRSKIKKKKTHKREPSFSTRPSERGAALWGQRSSKHVQRSPPSCHTTRSFPSSYEHDIVVVVIIIFFFMMRDAHGREAQEAWMDGCKRTSSMYATREGVVPSRRANQIHKTRTEDRYYCFPGTVVQYRIDGKAGAFRRASSLSSCLLSCLLLSIYSRVI